MTQQPRHIQQHSSQPHTGLTWPVPVHDMVLIIGSWKKNYTELALQTMLANALNRCSRHHYFTVVAYIITGKRLGLVLEKHPGKNIAQLLQVLYQEVSKEIKETYWLKARGTAKVSAQEQEKSTAGRLLFRAFAQHNAYVGRLITARPLRHPYYDPHLARLEALVKGHRFCSAIDYSGGTGPVNIKLLSLRHT